MKRIMSLILLAAVWLATVTAVCRYGSVPSVYFLPTVLTALVIAWQCFHWRLRNRANPKDDTRREVLEENNRAVLGTWLFRLACRRCSFPYYTIYIVRPGRRALAGRQVSFWHFAAQCFWWVAIFCRSCVRTVMWASDCRGSCTTRTAGQGRTASAAMFWSSAAR